MQGSKIVIGEGWAATAAAGFWAAAGHPVSWVVGTGARIRAPLPFFGASPGVAVWQALARRLGIDAGESQKGCFLREFRKQGFRKPIWTQAPAPADRYDVFQETLWEGECRITAAFEERFEMGLMDLEEEIRKAVFGLKSIERIEGPQVSSIEWSGEVGSLALSTGQKLDFSELVYADRWTLLKTIQGPPAPVRSQIQERKLKPYPAFQLLMEHDSVIGSSEDLKEGFLIELIREAGEEIQRHVWGGFFGAGRKSLWTVVLTPEEGEDNHQIAKRLRRIKQALNKCFSAPEWIGPDKKEFTQTVVRETVCFEEEAFFGAGDPKILNWEGAPIWFLTDSFGPASALDGVGRTLGEVVGLTKSELPIGP